MSDVRRDAVKAYIIALIQEGSLKGLRNPSTIALRVITLFSSDAKSATKELFGMAMESAVNNVGPYVAGVAERVARDVAERGVRAIWADFQTQLRRK